MGENQPESVATGSGRMGTDETTLSERVELSSFGAVGDRLSVQLSSSRFAACPGDTQAPRQSNVPLKQPEQVERDTTSQKNGSRKT